jgi:hypothetical protein
VDYVVEGEGSAITDPDEIPIICEVEIDDSN